MFYIEDNNKIVLFDEDKQKLQNTVASKVFKGCLRTAGVGSFKAQVMYLAVDNF